MLKKSTTPHQATPCPAQIARDYKFHTIEAKHYSLLFNQAATGPDLLQYTPWQKYCQDQAIFHQHAAWKLSVIMHQLEQAV